MRPTAVDVANQALLREGLSQAQNRNHSAVVTPMATECIESTFDEPTDEPDLPSTYIRCTCGELVPLHVVECPECGAPHPRRVERSA